MVGGLKNKARGAFLLSDAKRAPTPSRAPESSRVEDSRGTRESLRELLGRAPGLRCVGAHANGEEALRQIPAENPDVVLMNINLPGMSGIECVAQLRERDVV